MIWRAMKLNLDVSCYGVWDTTHTRRIWAPFKSRDGAFSVLQSCLPVTWPSRARLPRIASSSRGWRKECQEDSLLLERQQLFCEMEIDFIIVLWNHSIYLNQKEKTDLEGWCYRTRRCQSISNQPRSSPPLLYPWRLPSMKPPRQGPSRSMMLPSESFV